MKELFIKFLEEKGVKEQYFKNFNPKLNIDDLHPEDYFIVTFSWFSTEEGYEFWYNLDIEWWRRFEITK